MLADPRTGELAGALTSSTEARLPRPDDAKTGGPCRCQRRHHGICADRLERPLDDAQRIVEQACAEGADLEELWRMLEERADAPGAGSDLFGAIR